jgi:peptidyl-prolyl cis-trans isomerase A (cyclophilin A)
VSYAMAGPGSRTTQIFINFGNNGSLDPQGFAPFGEVTQGMDVVDKLHAGYGDAEPRGKGPNQTRVRNEGNEYMDRDFPQLDRVMRATVVEDEKK